MVVEELIEDDDKPTLMRALLLRHRHVNEHGHGAFGFVYRRKFSSYTSLQVRCGNDSSLFNTISVENINIWIGATFLH